MIKLCKEEQKNSILKYIGEDYYKCIYLYMNLEKYGCENENVKVYVAANEKGETTGVFLKYFNCLHVFSKNEDVFASDIDQVVLLSNPRVMFLSDESQKKMSASWREKYNVFYDTLFEAVRYEDEEDSLELVQASMSELDEIVEFLMSDEFYASIYEKEALKKQMRERMEDNYSRSFVMRNDGKIVFHMATTAELPEFMIGGLGLLHTSMRGQGMGKRSFAKFYNNILCMGVKCYCFPADERAYNLHKKLGFKIKHTPVKMVLKQV